MVTWLLMWCAILCLARSGEPSVVERNAAEFAEEIADNVTVLRGFICEGTEPTPDDFNAVLNLIEGALKNLSRIAAALEDVARQDAGK